MTRVRFAPSPTGYIHIGNARTALFNYLYAKHTGGEFCLRIEDTDRERSKPEYEEALKKDLDWLGVHWDGEVVRQSARGAIYRASLDQLKAQGDVYPCFCTPEELDSKRQRTLKEKRPPRYDGTCRKLSTEEAGEKIKEGLSFTYRFKIKDPLVEFHDLIKGKISVNLDDMVGDFVVARGDGSPIFHLAVCVDDAEMEITHVVRGEDHLSNTPRHILIFKALGKPVPQFAHMPLILGEDGKPLSKRLGDFSLKAFREKGVLPEGLLNYMALLGWSSGDDKEIFTFDELAKAFSIEKINTSPARFNSEKLRWVMHEHFGKVSDDILSQKTKPFIKSDAGSLYDEAGIKERLVFLKDSAATFEELGSRFDIVFGPAGEPELDGEALSYVKDDSFPKLLKTVKETAQNSKEKYLADINVYKEALKPLGLKGPKLFKPIRLVLTGSLHGPELKLLLPLIPRELVLRRIEKLEKKLEQ